MPSRKRDIGGVLLLYRRPVTRFFRDAATIDDHIASFGRHSRHPVYAHNTDLGFPRDLDGARFDAVVCHYSLFGHGGSEYPVPPRFWRYLDQATDSYKVVFFHDEHTFCGRRFAFLNDRAIDCVFTMLEPPEFEKVYGAHAPGVSKIVSHLPGYVSEEMAEVGRRLTVPEPDRPTDVGFRARPLEPFMGFDEKAEIGRRFAELAAGTDLVTDIQVSPESLLPGEAWYRFIAGCRTVLGVESGTSCFDLEDEVWNEYARLSEDGHQVTVDELRPVIERWTDRVYYKTIGPRNFEAASLRVCQVLFEGRYSGVMEPMRHYIPLRKDLSNFDQVLSQIRDAELRAELAGNAYDDLIASGRFTFAGLIELFDRTLAEAGLEPAERDDGAAAEALRRSGFARAGANLRSSLSYHPLSRRLLYRVARPPLEGYRRLRRRWTSR